MTIENDDGRTHEINSLSDPEKRRAKDFLQGCVYCWCKNKPNKIFALRDLVGGANRDWNGTPLQPIYDHYRKSKTDDEAFKQAGKDADNEVVKQAGKDAGWLLKSVLRCDRRRFMFVEGESPRRYRWVKG